MMAAFSTIGSGAKVEPSHIAKDISIALICTALGLLTAIPFNFLLASIQNRLRVLQEGTSAGMLRVLEALKAGRVQRLKVGARSDRRVAGNDAGRRGACPCRRRVEDLP